jgi:hypothetical protein
MFAVIETSSARMILVWSCAGWVCLAGEDSRGMGFELGSAEIFEVAVADGAGVVF